MFIVTANLTQRKTRAFQSTYLSVFIARELRVLQLQLKGTNFNLYWATASISEYLFWLIDKGSGSIKNELSYRVGRVSCCFLFCFSL